MLRHHGNAGIGGRAELDCGNPADSSWRATGCDLALERGLQLAQLLAARS
ncbi:MAG: hypothetical protein IT185_12285 [Acidobacteria bacterium]|nr:hypothetical protein [Acidobacteriota bacterium]